jgi:Di-haem cytochrome c peroxidase
MREIKLRRFVFLGAILGMVIVCSITLAQMTAPVSNAVAGPLPPPVIPRNEIKLTPVEQLGKFMLYDHTLSNPPGYACATCHVPEAGFTGPDSSVNLFGGPQPGVVPGRFSNRKPQSYVYAAFCPVGPVFRASLGVYIGGDFWDGRVPDLSGQAKQPPINPNEMANTPMGPYVSTPSGRVFTASRREAQEPPLYSPFPATHDILLFVQFFDSNAITLKGRFGFDRTWNSLILDFEYRVCQPRREGNAVSLDGRAASPGRAVGTSPPVLRGVRCPGAKVIDPNIPTE